MQSQTVNQAVGNRMLVILCCAIAFNRDSHVHVFEESSVVFLKTLLDHFNTFGVAGLEQGSLAPFQEFTLHTT